MREHRAERAARHDDGAFRAERSARANGDGAEIGFRIATLRSMLLPSEQDGLERFGNAVAANFVLNHTRHQPHDQRARHRHEDHPQSQMIALRHGRGRGPAVIKSQVRNRRNQPEQGVGDKRRTSPR